MEGRFTPSSVTWSTHDETGLMPDTYHTWIIRHVLNGYYQVINVRTNQALELVKYDGQYFIEMKPLVEGKPQQYWYLY